MIENNTMTEADAHRSLREALMRSAPHMTTEQADAMLDEIRAGCWNIQTFVALAKLVATISPEQPHALLCWMQVTLSMLKSPNGRELVFAAGMHVADLCGVTTDLLDTLRARVTPSAGETRH